MMIRTLTPFLLITATACQILSPQSDSPFVSSPRKLLDQHAGEGPAYHPDWGMLFSGGGDITRLKANGQSETFRPRAGSNGLLFDAEGRLIICEPAQRRVTRLEQNGELTVLTDHYEGRPYNQPNDLALDDSGRIYFSDPRYGSRDDMQIRDPQGRAIEGVYRIDPDGRVTRIITHEVDRPNGLLIPPDNRYLYVADNNNNVVAAPRKLWRFDLEDDGTVDFDSQKLIYDWRTGRGPDGMAIDAAGYLYVAGGRNRANLPAETDDFPGGIYVFSPRGQLVETLPIPHDEVTNCAFGGPDLRDLYITAGGTLWMVRTHATGIAHWDR